MLTLGGAQSSLGGAQSSCGALSLDTQSPGLIFSILRRSLDALEPRKPFSADDAVP